MMLEMLLSAWVTNDPPYLAEGKETILNALLGGGTQTTSIINGIHFGSSSAQEYPNINNALDNLGFRIGTSTNTQRPEWGKMPSLSRVGGHENHYHIYLRPPTATAVPIKLSGQQLNTSSAASNISISETFDKDNDDYSTNPTPQKLPARLIKKIENSKACTFAENQSSITKLGEPYGLLRPTEFLIGEIINAHDSNKKIRLPFGVITATLSAPPAHGKVIIKLPGEEVLPGHKTMAGTYVAKEFVYVPNPDFYGIDKLQFKVNYNGQIIKVNYQVHVLEQNSDDCTEPEGFIPGLMQYQQQITVTLDSISEEASDTAFYLDNNSFGNTLDAYIAELAGTTYSYSMLEQTNITFANLTGTAIGETTGEGANAVITLDTDAAGHGWYWSGISGQVSGINNPATPWYEQGLFDMQNWLPTSNPNEWVARAGTAAAGKMDMLSVLLHEYGHALGIEHSADSHDYMATTLTPGMRRLPSADAMQLMAQLAGEARDAIMAGNGYILTVASTL